MKNKNINERRFRIDKTDIIIFLIIIVTFSIALLSFFPGLVTSDVVDQIEQAKANLYRDAHPIFHSFVIGNLAKLGGIWVPEIFQILIFALIWTYGCKKIREYNNTNKNKFLQILLTIFICIIPLNFIYSIVLWKDILYSYSILAILILVYIGIKEKFKYTTFEMINISIFSAAIMKLRHNGMPIGLFMFLLLFILNLKNNKKLKQSLTLIISFIVVLILMTLPKWIWGDKNKNINVGGVLDSTKVYCMGALLNTDIELEEEEKEFLNTIYNIEKWTKNYDSFSGTAILFDSDYHNEVLGTEEGNKKFNEIFMKYASKDIGTIVKHFIDVNSIWWSVEEKGPMHSIILSNGYLSESTNGIYDNKPILENMHQKLWDYSINTLETPGLYEFLYRPAVAIIISFGIIIAVWIKTKNFRYIFILFPMVLNIGTYVFLISSQDQRYFYPCYMTEYLSILIFLETFIKQNKIKYHKKDKKINKSNPKTLVIIPAYNESESIENVVKSVYEQEIDNCDIIVVNDGSKDNTCEEAQKTKAIVIDAPNNLGIGGAVQTGYLYAYKNNYDIAIQLDGDGQHDPKYIKSLIEEIKNGTDMVIGSRFVKKTNYEQTTFRMLGINIISYIIKKMTDVKIYDTTSGYRAVNKNIIEEFVEEYPYDYPEPCTNMSVLKKGYCIKEIPVEMKKRETGVSSISPLKSISYMFKVTLSILLMGLKK